MQRRNRLVVLFASALLFIPALASADLLYRGWGIHAGIGDDPDQGIIGAQWDLGTITTNLRFMPNFELGFGDNQTIAGLTLPLHYVFPVSGSISPYAGGGALLAYINRDNPNKSNEFEVAVVLAFGLDWRLKSKNKLFVELDLASGDAHDVKLLFGWTWMRQ